MHSLIGSYSANDDIFNMEELLGIMMMIIGAVISWEGIIPSLFSSSFVL